MPDKLKILVVDDEAHILHVVSLKLRNAGYEVITAEDGEEGLEAAIEHRPDLIITDYQMPFMTGLELCKALKQHEVTRATPALMLTARGFSLAEELLDQTNIAAVISKPFSPREILAKVVELIGGDETMSEEREARSEECGAKSEERSDGHMGASSCAPRSSLHAPRSSAPDAPGDGGNP